MGEAFAWINQIFEYIWAFVPQLEVVPYTHEAIKFVRGKKVVHLKPGLTVYWPVVTKFVTYPIKRQANDLPSQTMETTDGQTAIVGGIIVYEIKDLPKILAETYDPDQTINDITQGAIHRICSQKSWAQLKDPGLERELRREVQKRLRPYGVRVRRVTLTSLARARVYKLLQSTSQEGRMTSGG